MKKSICSKWHAKLALAIVVALAIYLAWESFQTGVKEGRALREGRKGELQAGGK